jgi:hypothetical protein
MKYSCLTEATGKAGLSGLSSAGAGASSPWPITNNTDGNKDANSAAYNNNGGRDANNSGDNTDANDAICASDATCASDANKPFRRRLWARLLLGTARQALR